MPYFFVALLLAASTVHAETDPQLSRVTVTADTVQLEGFGSAGSKVRVMENPVWLGEEGPGHEVVASCDAKGAFRLNVPRLATDGQTTYDRLLSRWSAAPDQAGVYATSSKGAPTPRRPKPRSKKGLGGFTATRGPIDDLDQLGISSVTVNIMLRFLHLEPADGRKQFNYSGVSYYVDRAAIAELDATLRVAAEHDLLVFAILLVPPPRDDSPSSLRLAHPDYDRKGTFAMPNVVTKEGVGLYAASLEYLAQRYATANSMHGRIHDWIVHNEVDAGTTWTNAGDKGLAEYVDLYHRSLRITHLVTQQYDAASRVYASLTHSWAAPDPGGDYAGRGVLDELVRQSEAAGDFDWGIAHHPYPHSLFHTAIWDDPLAVAANDAQVVTMRNIEVLAAWARRPENRFEGRVRSIWLTEQGFHSTDYTDKSLRQQAAAMVYAWKKLVTIPEIEGFHYHNWIDNRHEGGLRIGLRRFADDQEEPLGKKPIWRVYQALGTEAEDKVCRFALPIVGVKKWSEILDSDQMTDSP